MTFASSHCFTNAHVCPPIHSHDSLMVHSHTQLNNHNTETIPLDSMANWIEFQFHIFSLIAPFIHLFSTLSHADQRDYLVVIPNTTVIVININYSFIYSFNRWISSFFFYGYICLLNENELVVCFVLSISCGLRFDANYFSSHFDLSPSKWNGFGAIRVMAIKICHKLRSSRVTAGFDWYAARWCTVPHFAPVEVEGGIEMLLPWTLWVLGFCGNIISIEKYAENWRSL